MKDQTPVRRQTELDFEMPKRINNNPSREENPHYVEKVRIEYPAWYYHKMMSGR